MDLYHTKKHVWFVFGLESIDKIFMNDRRRGDKHPVRQ
jgi:hypothetical protein